MILAKPHIGAEIPAAFAAAFPQPETGSGRTPSRLPRDTMRRMTYAVVWSEDGGPPNPGSLEVADRHLVLAGRAEPGRHLSYDDLAEARLERLYADRLSGRPTLALTLRGGEVLRVASMEGGGTLHELADRIAAARPAA